jgi:hypothetical protein
MVAERARGDDQAPYPVQGQVIPCPLHQKIWHAYQLYDERRDFLGQVELQRNNQE